MIDARRAKGRSDANRKNRSAKSRRRSPTNKMIGELRGELRLIDRTIAALTRLMHSQDSYEEVQLVNHEFPAHHAEDDDLQRYVLSRLSATEVDVLERHVFDCAECKDRLGTAAKVVAKILNLQRDHEGADRRTEPRFDISDAVSLRSLSPALPDRWPVQIVDISKNGLGLLVPTRLPPGVLVQVQSGRTFALGEVRYSRQISEHEFHTGIRLHDVVAPYLGHHRQA